MYNDYIEVHPIIQHNTAEPTKPLFTEKRVQVSLKRLGRNITSIIFFFAAMHILTIYFQYGVLNQSVSISPILKTAMKTFIKLFWLSSERSFPTLFSTLILLASSGLLYVIHRLVPDSYSEKRQKYWFTLSCIFFFLAIDEAFSIHEQLDPIIQKILPTNLNGFLLWAWVVPYAFFVIGVVAYFLPFVLRLPKQTRNLIMLSGAIYVGGALGLEFVEGYVLTHFTPLMNEGVIMVQEVMEMAGIALFIYTLLQYIRSNSVRFKIIV